MGTAPQCGRQTPKAQANAMSAPYIPTMNGLPTGGLQPVAPPKPPHTARPTASATAETPMATANAAVDRVRRGIRAATVNPASSVARPAAAMKIRTAPGSSPPIAVRTDLYTMNDAINRSAKTPRYGQSQLTIQFQRTVAGGWVPGWPSAVGATDTDGGNDALRGSPGAGSGAVSTTDLMKWANTSRS